MSLNRKINILMVTPQLSVGGAESQVVQLATFLAERGHQIVIYSKGGKLEEHIRGDKIRSIHGPIHSKTPLNLLRSYIDIIKIITGYKIDLIHCHAAIPSILCWAAKCKFRKPVITTGHGWPQNKVWMISRILNLTSDRIIAISNQLFTEYVKNGVNPSRISVVHNAIDVNKYEAIDSIATRNFRLKYNLGDADIVIGLVARMRDYRKGHVLAIDGLKDIISKHQNAKLLLVGDGLVCSDIKKYVAHHQLDQNVIFAGEQSDMPIVYSSLDIVVLPSEQEGLPIVLLEGMASGKPVVASHIDGVVDVVVDGETGFLFPKNDQKELVKKLTALIISPQLREAMGAKGKLRVRKYFSIQVNFKKIEDLYYESIVEKNPSNTR